jgi:uncharacterized protein (DUF302 family)
MAEWSSIFVLEFGLHRKPPPCRVGVGSDLSGLVRSGYIMERRRIEGQKLAEKVMLVLVVWT